MTFNDQFKTDLRKRYFILTDGDTKNDIECISFVQSKCQNLRLYIFSLGLDSNTAFGERLAVVGGGTHSLVHDGNLRGLKGTVVKALQTSMNPILTDCRWGFNQFLKPKVDLTRNQQVFDSEFFSIDDFSNGNFKWSLHIKDQEKNQSFLEYTFGQPDFEELTGQQADALFKIVAHRKIIDPNYADKAKKL